MKMMTGKPLSSLSAALAVTMTCLMAVPAGAQETAPVTPDQQSPVAEAPATPPAQAQAQAQAETPPAATPQPVTTSPAAVQTETAPAQAQSTPGTTAATDKLKASERAVCPLPVLVELEPMSKPACAVPVWRPLMS